MPFGPARSSQSESPVDGTLYVSEAKGPPCHTVGQWDPQENGVLGYAQHLSVISYEAHFRWLYENRDKTGFSGVVCTKQEVSDTYSSVAALQAMFVTTVCDALVAVINGLNTTSMKTILTNIIAPLENANLNDFEMLDARVIFVMEDYDPDRKTCNGVGVAGFTWHLMIHAAGNAKYRAMLKVDSRAALYSAPGDLCRDYRLVCDHFGLTPDPCPP